MNLKRSLPAALAGAALLGGGGGAGIYAAFASGGAKTVVRQVAVANAQPAASQSLLSVGEIYRRTHKGVVEITVTSTQSDPYAYGGSQQQQGQGSGFVFDTKGNIVTAAHVVEGATSVSVKFWNGAVYSAQVVGTDASTDLAVIRVKAPASALVPIPLGDSSKLSVGDGVVAIGSPFGLEESVTAGIVSALHRQMTSPNNYTIDDSIQTDAAINHGNSGGPLLNGRGQVIGVNAQIESDSGGNDGVGFAVPSNTIRSIVSKLIASGRVDHAYLGVSVATIPASAAARLGVPAGVEVTGVNNGTAAADAGLQGSTSEQTVQGQSYPTGGDVVTAVDGKQVTTANALRAAIDAKSPGDRLTLTYTRDGSSHTVTVTLRNRPS